MPILPRLYFAVYLLLFFGKAQEDSLHLLESQLLGQYAPHTPWLLAVILTALAYALTTFLSKRFAKHHKSTSAVYVLTAWMVTILVSLPFASWLYLTCLTIIAAALCAASIYLQQRWETKHEGAALWHPGMSYIAFLLALSLYMGIGAAATDVEHYEMQTAQLLHKERHNKVKHIGKEALDTSRRLVAMRAYAMGTAPGLLGDRFFDQPLERTTDATSLLLPTDCRQELMFSADSLCKMLGAKRPTTEEQTDAEKAEAYFKRVAESRGFHPSVAADYYLCALLANRKIDAFAQEIQRYYPRQTREQKHMPKYYAQALVMYTHLRTRPAIVYSDAATEANFKDYSDMGDSLKNAAVRNNLLRRSYGETYWWYYKEGKYAQHASH